MKLKDKISMLNNLYVKYIEEVTRTDEGHSCGLYCFNKSRAKRLRMTMQEIMKDIEENEHYRGLNNEN